MLVDDSEVVRFGIRGVLAASDQANFVIVAEAANAADAIALCEKLKPDVVLMDIRLPGMSGIEACREIVSRDPSMKIIILTSFSNDSYVYDAIASGARGYLMKEINPAGLAQALVDASQGKSILDPESTARVMRMVRSNTSGQSAGNLGALSAQEHRVLALVAEGRTNKEIGEKLGLSDNTVKNYLSNVFEKLGVKRRSQAVSVFMQAQDE
jgi:two-component system response regulator DevR